MKDLKQYPKKIIDFYYFSGTGNTLLIVKEIAAFFRKNKFKVTIFPIEKTDPQTINKDHIIGLGFPVAAQGTYPFIWQFINDLPPASFTPLFLVDTLMLYSGGILGPIKKIVEKKRYIPLGAKEFIMPSNVFVKENNNNRKWIIIKRALKKAENFANKLLHGRATWIDLPLYSDLMAMISKSVGNWKFFESLTPIGVDRSKCTSCGLCEKLCPTHNITLAEFPEFLHHCVLCMRCFSYCPENAIYFKHYRSAQYRAVEVDELLHHSSEHNNKYKD